ncbi:hypothetical protein [Agromyces arachidis]|uniref:hypothetical protein n=1 Tax=Agromyces arachidis TaxID=766966 RepID=UPI0040559F51
MPRVAASAGVNTSTDAAACGSIDDGPVPTRAARTEEPMADDPGTQDAPIEDGATDASRSERIRGILVQVREDVRMGHAPDEAALLRQRLADAGISVSDDEIERYVAHE